MIKDVGVTGKKSPPPVRELLTDWERVVAMHTMLTSLAKKVNAGHLLNCLADRVKNTSQRADLEAAMAEFQAKLDEHY